ncbi:MAG: zinc ABC transporter substrate-binding protein [Atopostipes suicloacalis]|nr:zinc ABC transporter substrate-binding protein [Atopostipes suicloacalis]
MKKILKYFTVLSMGLLFLAACGSDNGNEAEESDGKLNVVTSFTILADIAEQIGGEDVNIHNLVPTGTDPHEYEPLPKDMKAATDADILLYNGLNLEGGKEGWFFKMVDAVDQEEDKIYNLSEGVKPMNITDELDAEQIEAQELDEEEHGEINPHAFISPQVGIILTENMRDAFVEQDPDHADAYEERASDYLDRLGEMDQKYHEVVQDIPEEDRILVTSERAFQYMTEEYGLKEGFIWALDTEDTGTPEQIKSLVSFIEKYDVPVLFIESNVDSRPMETVSNQTGVPFSDRPIYSDEIGKKGDEVDTYMKFLEYNINLIHDELVKADR